MAWASIVLPVPGSPFNSAEFMIFVVELVIVWGTNFYLKKNNLDSISLDEFEKSQRQQKALIKAWAKLLMKHSVKVGPEFELLFLMGSTYGMKIKGIVKRQEERKELGKKNIVRKASKKKPEKETVAENQAVDTEFTLNVDEEIEEVVEKKKSSVGGINKIKSV